MIQEIFTKKNLQILKLVSEKPTHIRAISKELKCSPAKVHNATRLLRKEGLVVEKKEQNRKIIKTNEDSIILQKMKAFTNTYQFVNCKAYKKLKKLGDVGIYGSFANGTNDEKSDTDLWIYTDRKLQELMPLRRELEIELGKIVNIIILNKKKIELLRLHDPEFYIQLKLTSTYLGRHVI